MQHRRATCCALFTNRLSRSRISLRLLRESEHDPTAGIALFERLMPHIQLSNGIWRTTFKHRFSNLDVEVNRILRESFSPQEPITVEDWAASTCLTSCEWAETLFPIFCRAHFVASDRELFLVEVERGNTGEILGARARGEAAPIHPPAYGGPPGAARTPAAARQPALIPLGSAPMESRGKSMAFARHLAGGSHRRRAVRLGGISLPQAAADSSASAWFGADRPEVYDQAALRFPAGPIALPRDSFHEHPQPGVFR